MGWLARRVGARTSSLIAGDTAVPRRDRVDNLWRRRFLDRGARAFDALASQAFGARALTERWRSRDGLSHLILQRDIGGELCDLYTRVTRGLGQRPRGDRR